MQTNIKITKTKLRSYQSKTVDKSSKNKIANNLITTKYVLYLKFKSQKPRKKFTHIFGYLVRV